MLSHVRDSIRRSAAGIILLTLLAVCGCIGVRKDAVQTVSASISRVPYTNEIEPQSVVSASDQLRIERERELELLKEIAASESADEKLKSEALTQISQIVERIEIEAETVACLMEMGIETAAAVVSAQGITLILPEDSLKSEEPRIRVINAVSGLTGYKAADIKIILAKK